MGVSARNARILIGGYNLSGSFTEFTPEGMVGLEDTTAFGSATDSKSFTPTLTEGKLDFKGWWDGTAVSGVSAVLESAFGSASQTIVTVFPEGDTVGKPALFMSADEKSKKLGGKVSGIAEISAAFQSDTGLEYGVSLHDLKQETGAGNGTIVDNGALTSNGGSATFHCTAITTNVTMKIYHSTDNFGANDVLLATFGLQTTIGGYRVTWSGTTNRYLRVEWLQTGNWTGAVAVRRA